MKKIKVIIIVETITSNITNNIVDIIARPITEYFWKRTEEIDNITTNNIDTLVEKAMKFEELEKEFNSLPEWLKQYIGNSKKSDFIK